MGGTAWSPGLDLKLKLDDAPDMRILLINRPDNVALVRQALDGIATALNLDEAMLADVRTVVSEACNNVVLHAYDGGTGPLEVYVSPNGSELSVVVRDHGTGIQPHPPEPEAGVQGVGLSLIQALTDRVEFRGSTGEGTEVRMGFDTGQQLDVGGGESDEVEEQLPPPEGDTVVSVVAGKLAAPVLGRVVGMLSARAGFSVERLADAQIISDALAAHAPRAVVGRHIHLGLDTRDGGLDLRVGPLQAGGGDLIVRESTIAGLTSVIQRLADQVAVERSGSTEELRLGLTDTGSGAVELGRSEV